MYYFKVMSFSLQEKKDNYFYLKMCSLANTVTNTPVGSDS